MKHALRWVLCATSLGYAACQNDYGQFRFGGSNSESEAISDPETTSASDESGSSDSGTDAPDGGAPPDAAAETSQDAG